MYSLKADYVLVKLNTDNFDMCGSRETSRTP